MRSIIAFAITGVLCLLWWSPAEGVIEPEGIFLRADSNSDGQVDMSDWSYTTSYLFLGGPPPTCMDAADFNDDGVVDTSDPIATLNWLYSGGPPPSSPGPYQCGIDPTYDTLGCVASHCD